MNEDTNYVIQRISFRKGDRKIKNNVFFLCITVDHGILIYMSAFYDY